MAGDERRDVIIEHPNRRKPTVKATKAAVIVLLLASVALMLIVAIGGWSKLEGMRGVLVAWMAVYVVLAFYCARWMRGTLPLAAALGILLLIFAAIAGPEWFARDKPGFVNPALDSDLLGIITLLLVPVQFLLIAFSMRGFQQDWHVEVERPPGEPGPAAV
jgi:hypothetical protein